MESVEGPSTWVHCSRPSACQAHEYYYYYPQYDREIHHKKRNLPRSQMATFADEVFPDKLQSRSVHSFTLFSYKLSTGHTEILSAKLEAKKESEDSSTPAINTKTENPRL